MATARSLRPLPRPTPRPSHHHAPLDPGRPTPALHNLALVLAPDALAPDDDLAAADLDVMLRLCLLRRDGHPSPTHAEEADALHTALLVAYQLHGAPLAHHVGGVSYHIATLAALLHNPA